MMLGALPDCFSQDKKTSEKQDLTQLPDSLREKMHSPTKAAVFSAVLPGLGQAYNRKYWKIPIIYAGFGVLTYFIVTNADQYMTYQSAIIEQSNGDTNGNYAYLVNKYTESQLQSAREYYRRNLEISILLTAVLYSLNILDALVDAHLMTFNINQELTFRVRPVILPPVMHTAGAYTGLQLSLRF
jgi:hypothetical protein